jgi:transcriptional regulator with XRE-family HTH domain
VPRTAASDIASRLIGKEIRRARVDEGLTQAEVGLRLGASPSYVANVEAGRLNLTVGQLARIADAIGTDLQVRLPRLKIERLAVDEPAPR